MHRRRCLRTIGAGFTGAVAGCLSSVVSRDESIDVGAVDVPAGDRPTYREWIPFPADGAEWTIDTAVYLRPGILSDKTIDTRPLLSVQQGLTRPFLDYVGVGFENYDEVFTIGSTIVGRGPVDRDIVRETVLESGYVARNRDETAAYDLFERSNPDARLAVDDSAIAFERGTYGPSAEAVLEAGRGRRERLVDADDALSKLTRYIGSQPGILFTGEGGGDGAYGMDDISEIRQSAATVTYDAETVYTQLIHVFEAIPSLSTDDVESWLAEESDRSYAETTVDVTIDGDLLAIETAQSHEHWRDERDGDAEASPPQITWWFEPEDDGASIVVSHRGGEPVDAAALRVGFGAGIDLATRTNRQFDDEYDTVQPGDSIAVDVRDRPDDEPLSIVYDPGDRNATSPLRSYRFD